MDIVTSGYRLPLIALPNPVFQRNHRSAIENFRFVSAAVEELVEARCLIECAVQPRVCSPLQVVFNSSGKPRLVLDLRYINQYLLNQKFKYEGLDLVPAMFEHNNHFFTFDLKSMYHHVDIHTDCWTYLGLSWSNKFYMFAVLPFGLSTACYVFTKLLRPLVKRWRSLGLRVIVYIDDGICAAGSHSKCLEYKELVVSDLGKEGFVLNIPKSQLEPLRVGRWLGFILDLETGCFKVSEEKIERLKSVVQKVLPMSQVGVRLLASIVGQIMSMSLALGPIARLRTRALYGAIDSQHSWSDQLKLSDDARDELLFWQTSIAGLNAHPIWFSPGTTRVAFSDASSTGYGGYVVELGSEVAHGQWSELQMVQSSTWRELKAVDLVLRSFASKLAGHAVKWFSDNQNIVRIVQAGSRQPHLQDGAMSIFEICWKHGIRLEMAWIPRSLNDRADYISRIVDFDDWRVSPSAFAYLDSQFGPHTVDCFASGHNSQLQRFHSRYWDPGSEAVDTFTVSWRNETCWWVPPLHLVCRTIRHARECEAVGTLVVPLWKSAPFWPLLCPDGRHLAPFIHGWFALNVYPGLLLPGLSGNNLGDSLTSDTVVLVLAVNFSLQPRRYNAGFCMVDDSGSCSHCSLSWHAP